MDDKHAQRLKKRALGALSDLRAWLWQQHARLLPDDVSRVSREQATLYSAYLDWYSRLEEALTALEAAAPAPVRPVMDATVPPTGRASAAPRPTLRSAVWHRTIPVIGPAGEPPSTRRSAA